MFDRLFDFIIQTIGALVPFANFLLSLVLATFLFAAIYKFLPDIDIEWSDVAMGAFVTAVLYELGQVLIGFYFENNASFSARGVAGSMIVLLMWIYYSAQVFLLGAEFTKVWSRHYGSRRHKN